MFAPDTTLRDFFDTWPAASPLFAGIATPEYKLDKVYGSNPTGAITDMSKIASIDEITDILTSMPEVSYKLLRDDISATDLEHTVNLESLTQFFASSGDYISLAEHHLYGNSRLGVQKYESNTIANILNLPPPDEALVRTTLRNRQPWYSYPFADLIDSTKRSPYLMGSLTGNAYLGEWKTSRTLGSKYYEMTDHLGNVLATILDRKTGAGADGSGSLYDHWSADLASTADYYPGGMMMPGRNTEYSWSRMGSQHQQKDDEVYGKGNTYAYKYRMEDARINRFFSTDPLHFKYPHNSDYAFGENRLIDGVELEGLEYYSVHMQSNSNGTRTLLYIVNYTNIPRAGMVNIPTKNGYGPQGDVGVNYTEHYEQNIYKQTPVGAEIVGTLKQSYGWNVKNNIYGVYAGSNNPKKYWMEPDPETGEYPDDYSLPPIDEADANGRQHDLDYDKLKLTGVSGILSKKSTPANEAYRERAATIVDKYNHKKNDSETGRPVTKKAADAAHSSAEIGWKSFNFAEMVKHLKRR